MMNKNRIWHEIIGRKRLPWRTAYPAMIFLTLLPLGDGYLLSAAEFRAFVPIPAPVSSAQEHPGGGLRPVPRAIVKRAVEKMVAAWNANSIGQFLGEDFFDRFRVIDAMNSRVPRDARLAILSVQDVQTLGQKYMDSPSGRLLVSTVSVTVKTQVTFNDPVNGYQRREGVNEYILRIRQLTPL